MDDDWEETTVEGVACDECGHVVKNELGLKIHKGREHKDTAEADEEQGNERDLSMPEDEDAQSGLEDRQPQPSDSEDEPKGPYRKYLQERAQSAPIRCGGWVVGEHGWEPIDVGEDE